MKNLINSYRITSYPLLARLNSKPTIFFRAYASDAPVLPNQTFYTIPDDELQEAIRGYEIKTVQDAIGLVDTLHSKPLFVWGQQKENYHPFAPQYKFPFGIWYRGHAEKNWGLLPSLFRHPKLYYDEPSIVRSFQAEHPQYSNYHRTTVEWLSLMQHYGAPTRLLDWSTSILTALYFAVADAHKDNSDGILWILHAPNLNSLTSLFNRQGVASSTRFDVAIRSEIALVNDIGDLVRRAPIRENYEIDAPETQENFANLVEKFHDEHSKEYKKLSMPIALQPANLSERLKAQRGVFTLFGGKHYFNQELYNQRLAIPKPCDLLWLNKIAADPQSRFLAAFLIASQSKPNIRQQLLNLGIHQASMFADLDHASAHITNSWTFHMP